MAAVLARGRDAALDTVGYRMYPHGSDPDEPFVDIVWWVSQEGEHWPR